MQIPATENNAIPLEISRIAARKAWDRIQREFEIPQVAPLEAEDFQSRVMLYLDDIYRIKASDPASEKSEKKDEAIDAVSFEALHCIENLVQPQRKRKAFSKIRAVFEHLFDHCLCFPPQIN